MIYITPTAEGRLAQEAAARSARVGTILSPEVTLRAMAYQALGLGPDGEVPAMAAPVQAAPSPAPAPANGRPGPWGGPRPTFDRGGES